MLVVVLLQTSLLPTSAVAKDVIRESANGGVNWTDGVVFAHGYGTAAANLTGAQRRILSRRAAVVDAQRNLLEITKGVRITSMSKVVDTMVADRVIATRVEGIIKGAQVIKDHYQNEVATVTMVMPIAGEILKVVWDGKTGGGLLTSYFKERLNRLIYTGNEFLGQIHLFPPAHAEEAFAIGNDAEANATRRLLEWIESASPQNVAQSLQDAITYYETHSSFSGLLIDASKVSSFELATVPNIRDEQGAIIYPSAETSYDDIVNKRGVSYDFDLQDAIRNQRVASSPLIIKALNTYKSFPSDLMISDEDASRIAQSASTRNAMNKAGVLIVVAI